MRTRRPKVGLDNAVFNNEAGAVYDFQADVPLNDFALTQPVEQFRRRREDRRHRAPALSPSISPTRRTGVVNVQTGTVSLGGGGTSKGGAFDVSAGATLDLTGGGGNTYTGSYTGSGSGTIQMSGGTLGTDGTTVFDFPGAMFQWTGGTITGALTNNGVMTAFGHGNKSFTSITFTNSGTFNETAGQVGLDNAAFDNQAGAVYDFQADVRLSDFGSTNQLNNSGTVEKTFGSGTSVVRVNVSNAGVFTSATGILSLTSGIGQVSGVPSPQRWSVQRQHAHPQSDHYRQPGRQQHHPRRRRVNVHVNHRAHLQ